MNQDLEDLSRTDVYLIDQILKGRIVPGSRLIDVGCGGGRNLPWFLRNGFDVTALDPNPEAFVVLEEELRCRGLELPASRRVLGFVESADLPAQSFDVVLSNAVLHFARGHAHFRSMLDATWRLVAPGGLFFARLTSSVGIEPGIRPLGDGRFWLPDDSERYLVTERALLGETERLGAELMDPIKSTVVQSLRTMTTWVMRRPHPG
ncbi:tellurite resistance protein TehB [Planctomycetes bacterium Poly30]|uniref:Tellurite resistance protein TehB n=1 Tax=Saltatorellus ferox TaxID=2528018 RepID=A0A518ERF1_9BACT|nr:tellurite resistance protein TehB [Planctomycetes bacterium Poly30]